MKHPQPPTPVATDNSIAERILNGTTTQKRFQAIKICQGQFHIFWEAGKKNVADYFTKHHATSHHQAMHPQSYCTQPTKTYKMLKTNAFTTSKGVLKWVRNSDPV
jgi:hypothetical protein